MNSIENCFSQSGANDFRSFIGHHLRDDRWIVASDYNTGSAGSEHDVYTFAAYPVSEGIQQLRENLALCFPRDFKQTSQITQEQKLFFHTNSCYCFVFLMHRSVKFFRTGNRERDLADVRSLIGAAIEMFGPEHADNPQIRHLKQLHRKSMKKDLSLYLLERIFILSLLNAYVVWKIIANTNVRIVAWFPDKDDMTIYCDSVFETLTYINTYNLWHDNRPKQEMPILGRKDWSSIDPSINHLVDDLIRVPDFMSAVLSRWKVRNRRLTPPLGSKRPAIIRYLQIMKHWLCENDNLWIGNCQMKEEDFTVGRIISAKSIKRLQKYSARVTPALPHARLERGSMRHREP